MSSISMCLVRVIRVSQIDDFGSQVITRVEDGIHVRDIIPNNYAYVEAYLNGFTGGARNRIKRFSCLIDVYAYLNKLNAGGWMNDVDYSDAWQKCLDIQRFTDLFSCTEKK